MPTVFIRYQWLLPTGEFRWLSDKDISRRFPDKDAIAHIPSDSATGYIFQVDLRYPQELDFQDFKISKYLCQLTPPLRGLS